MNTTRTNVAPGETDGDAIVTQGDSVTIAQWGDGGRVIARHAGAS